AELDLAAGSDPKSRRAHNVRGAQTVLTAAAAGGVGRVVLITSAMVYGARAENPVPIAESAPLNADPDGSVVGDFMEIEQLAERSPRANPGMSITIVRPAALVGEGIDTLVTRHFEAPRLLAVKGCAPRWQFCHVADLLSAIELAAAGEVKGAFAVGSDGWLEQDQVEELSGLRRIELPAGVTFGTAQRLHRAGITPAPVSALHYVVYPWVVDCQALREAGWQPSVTNAQALQVLLEQRAGHHAVAGRRLQRKDAAITAAGAAVAVIGTAALLRPVRERGRGAWTSRPLLGGRVKVIRLAELRDTPLSVDEVYAAVTDPAAGGIAVFVGAVRDHDHDRSVTALSYSAHPSATAELREVAEGIAARFDVHAVAAVHRGGGLAIGDLAVVVAVSSAHRGTAFDACRALIDELKATVPIWKHQRFTSGDSEWVNSA